MSAYGWRGKQVLALDPLISMEPLTVMDEASGIFNTEEKGPSKVFEKKDFVLVNEDPGGGAQ